MKATILFSMAVMAFAQRDPDPELPNDMDGSGVDTVAPPSGRGGMCSGSSVPPASRIVCAAGLRCVVSPGSPPGAHGTCRPENSGRTTRMPRTSSNVCPPGMVHTDCGNSCGPTCNRTSGVITRPSGCAAVCMVGCFCPPDMAQVLGRNNIRRCILPSECSIRSTPNPQTITVDNLAQEGQRCTGGSVHPDLRVNCAPGLQCVVRSGVLGSGGVCHSNDGRSTSMPSTEEGSCPNGCPGPMPGMPNRICPDGTVGGPVCRENNRGMCEWSIRQCPTSTSAAHGASATRPHSRSSVAHTPSGRAESSSSVNAVSSSRSTPSATVSVSSVTQDQSTSRSPNSETSSADNDSSVSNGAIAAIVVVIIILLIATVAAVAFWQRKPGAPKRTNFSNPIYSDAAPTFHNPLDDNVPLDANSEI